MQVRSAAEWLSAPMIEVRPRLTTLAEPQYAGVIS